MIVLIYRWIRASRLATQSTSRFLQTLTLRRLGLRKTIPKVWRLNTS